MSAGLDLVAQAFHPRAKRFGVIAVLIVIVCAVPAVAQQIPNQSQRQSAIQGVVRDTEGRGVPAVLVLLSQGAREIARTETSADGVFRFLNVPPGEYALTLSRHGFETETRGGLRIGRAELVTAEFTLRRVAVPRAKPTQVEPPPGVPSGSGIPTRRGAQTPEAAPIPPGEHVFLPVPDRWNLAMPDWNRYGVRGDYPYVSGRWWDPYNQNALKGDYPVLGKRTFFVFTGVSDSLLEGRNLPAGSAPSGERPLSEPFFGRGGQYFPVTVVRTSFDLFRGNTAYRPVDWRLRIQPAFSVNYLNTAESGMVNADVRRGSGRLSTHAGLQEAFGELKIADLSADYDFLSVRAGIQEFSSDFRGFLSVVESPGVRVFGTLASSRVEYNAAVFDLLEKETNSGFNEWARRKQQVWVGNVYVQDFLTPGYTTQFSVHHSRDRGEPHYDRNGFLVRPAPIGVIAENDINAWYIGWSGNGHVGRWNLSHAFYQALGRETFNPIAAQRVDINAQMVAAELSIDKDWLRIKGAFFYASGDGSPEDDEARGFDAILDIPVFAGGPFSLWNRQGLRLAQTATGLKSPASLLPTLRTNKDGGLANFVNPGILLLNGGLDVELTPKLRAFGNLSFLRFAHTETLETLLFQERVDPNIGLDYGVGAQYRPPLSDNVVLVGGFSGLLLGQGMKDIYTRKHLVSVFLNARLVF